MVSVTTLAAPGRCGGNAETSVPRGLQGVTLVEWLVVLGLAAILTAAAAHGWSQYVRDHALQAVARRLYGDLLYARSLALQTGRRVLLCPVRGEDGCVPGAAWVHGWQVHIVLRGRSGGEQAGHGGIKADRMAAAVPGYVMIRGNAPVRDYVGYDPDGTSRLHSGAFQAGTFTVCRTDRAAEAVRIVINAAGRPRWESVASMRCDA